MAKDNIEFKSLISQDLNFESPIKNSIDCNSQISNNLNFESPIGIEIIETEYRNGIVSNAVFGQTAVFDFEAKINLDTDVVFTVNWGAEVGTTIINSTLIAEVWKALQTSILIPEGVNPNQTILVTDDFGGSFEVNYTIESTFDPDAQAYLEAVGIPNDSTIFYVSTPQEITGAEIWTAVNNYFLGIKADGIYTKKKAIYLFIGGTASAHKYNAKDPRDLDAAFRLVFGGGLVHSSTGVLPDGTTGQANTFLNPLTHLPANSMALSFYSRTNANTGLDQVDIGIVSPGHLWLSTQYNASGFVNRFLARNSSVSILANVANADARGFYDCTKSVNGTNTFKIHKNGAVVDTQNGAGTNPDNNVHIFTSAFGIGTTLHSNREGAFASIGEGLTDAEAANDYTRVQALQTALHRQV